MLDVQRSAKSADKACQMVTPFMPAGFNVVTDNPLVSFSALDGKWQGAQDKDSTEQRRLQEEYIKAWRGVGRLHYTEGGQAMRTASTEVRAVPPFETPTFGGGEEDRARLKGKAVIQQRRQGEIFSADVIHLEQVREKKRTYKRIPENIYNGMLVAYTQRSCGLFFGGACR